MNADVKAKWVAALRSGDYDQTTGQLRDESGYCCLGVLCDLAVKAGAVKPWAKVDNDAFDYAVGGVAGHIPEPVRLWADTNSNPEVEYGDSDGITTLVDLNDVHGLPFFAIADVIEDQL